MKKLFIILTVMMVSSIFLTNCDKVKDLNTVDFDATFSGNLESTTLGERSLAIGPMFTDTAMIDPASDPNVNEYLDHIMDYEIQEIKATILAMSVPSMTIISGGIGIFNAQENVSWTFANEQLTVGKTLVLDNEDGKWNTVRQILLTGDVFSVYTNGEADASGVTFTIKIEIVTVVEAEVI